jgi:hypothetical protein
MEIHALEVRLTDADVADLAQRAVRDHDQLSDLRIRISSEGVHVSGTLHLMLRVPFETLWALSIRSGTLAVTLADLKAGGFPAGMLKGVLMSMIESEVEREPGVTVDGHTVVLDADRMIAAQGIQIHTNLAGVACQTGTLILRCEAGSADSLRVA